MKISKNLLILLFGSLVLACNESEPERPRGEYETGILIMNEGAFGTNDGEVFHYDPLENELQPNIFESVNGRPFAGLLEDIVLEKDRLYLVSNTGKVEVVNPGTFESLGAVVGDLDIPRSVAVSGNKLFISDYGPYDENFNSPDSYIAVVNGLDGGTVSKKIEVSSKPEDLFAFGDFIFVAGSEEGKVEIIDARTETVTKTLEVDGHPQQFFEYQGTLWLYSIDEEEIFMQSFHLDNLTKATTTGLPLSGATGRIALGNDDLFYVITSSGWPDYEDGVTRFAVIDSRLEFDWITGSGFYGIGFDQVTGELYLANAKGFQGNGEVSIYNTQGDLIKTMEVGRAPSGFFMN
ncbi:YncE family protein [Algoriphagus namhaensis]